MHQYSIYKEYISSHTRIYEGIQSKPYASKKISIQKEKEITFKAITSIDSKTYIKHIDIYEIV